jgi:hypothetical protein
MVLELDGNTIAAITGFPTFRHHQLHNAFHAHPA